MSVMEIDLTAEQFSPTSLHSFVKLQMEHFAASHAFGLRDRKSVDIMSRPGLCLTSMLSADKPDRNADMRGDVEYAPRRNIFQACTVGELSV